MLSINPSELILTIFNFFLLFFLMRLFLFTPIIKHMDARCAGIEQRLEHERQLLASAEERARQAELRRIQSMEQAKQILDQARAAVDTGCRELSVKLRQKSIDGIKLAEERARQGYSEECRLVELNKGRLAYLLAQSLMQRV